MSRRDEDGGMKVLVIAFFAMLLAVAVALGVIFHTEIKEWGDGVKQWFRAETSQSIDNELDESADKDESIFDDGANDEEENEVGDFVPEDGKDETTSTEDDGMWTKNY